MATKQKTGYKAGSKKASKKAAARRKPILDGNDPPIIVSGGGGPDSGGTKGRGKNKIDIEYSPAGGAGSGKFKGKVNNHTNITSVTIDFPGMVGINPPKPITISDYELYTIRIVFHTSS
jgi:hypothetical protein